MDEFTDSVMVALLPVETGWSTLDLPHLTLVYAGLVSDLVSTDFNKLAKDAASIAMMNRPIWLTVSGVEVFGDVDKVDALRFHTKPELEAMQHVVSPWDKSDFPFRPHATMGPVGTRMQVSNIPEVVTFDRVYVGWGQECLTFNMSR